jgi:hypothetical protein
MQKEKRGGRLGSDEVLLVFKSELCRRWSLFIPKPVI